MNRLHVSALLLFSTATFARGSGLPDGFYRQVYSNATLSVRAEDGRPVGISTNREVVNIRTVRLSSRDNWNMRFYLDIETPYDETLDKGPWYALVVNNKMYRQTSSGSSGRVSSSLGFNVESRVDAEAIAGFLSVKPLYRHHPGHQLAVTLEPARAQVSPGENVQITLRILNVGTNTIAFWKGGRNRAMRDNQYEFIARYKGKPIEDIGIAGHFGGLSTIKLMKPQDVFEDTVDLGKWFTLTKPGFSTVLGVYFMEFMDPDTSSSLSWFPIWEDRVAAEFTIEVKAPEETSNHPQSTAHPPEN